MVPNIRKMSLRELQQYIQERGPECFPEVIAALANDPREGAKRLVRLCQARLEDMERQKARLSRMYVHERPLWAAGVRHVVGMDEAGRGPLAGPVVAAAVVLPGEVYLSGLENVRRLPPRRREELHEQICRAAVAVGIGMAEPDGIDEPSVLVATYVAMSRALANLGVQPDHLLVDSLHVPEVNVSQTLVPGGEAASASIAAASVVARVTRDRYMVEMDRLYPQYGFAHHKGYGTAAHRAALQKYGPCPIHRRLGQDREVAPLSAARRVPRGG